MCPSIGNQCHNVTPLYSGSLSKKLVLQLVRKTDLFLICWLSVLLVSGSIILSVSQSAWSIILYVKKRTLLVQHGGFVQVDP